MKRILLLLVISIFALACKKNGTGGESEISFFVKHHDSVIPGATVYIKYGAKEFPGADVSKYDASIVTDVSGHSAGHSHFHDLLKGDYYLYAVGYDSSIARPVTGGIPVNLKSSSEQKDVVIPVTE